MSAAVLAGSPLDLIQPEIMRFKVAEPILLLGKQRFSNVDIRIRVKGGGHVSQIYAIRQAIAKAFVAFYQKCAPIRSHAQQSAILSRPLPMRAASTSVDRPSNIYKGTIYVYPLKYMYSALLQACQRRCDPLG